MHCACIMRHAARAILVRKGWLMVPALTYHLPRCALRRVVFAMRRLLQRPCCYRVHLSHDHGLQAQRLLLLACPCNLTAFHSPARPPARPPTCSPARRRAHAPTHLHPPASIHAELTQRNLMLALPCPTTRPDVLQGGRVVLQGTPQARRQTTCSLCSKCSIATPAWLPLGGTAA